MFPRKRSFTTAIYILVALLALSTAIHNVSAQYSFRTNNGTLSIQAYVGSGGSVEIPGAVAGMPIVSIEPYAFSAWAVTRVVIPNSITNIGDSSFEKCVDLRDVLIGDSVLTIGAHAFADCYTLTNVSVGTNVQTIGASAFRQCGSLIAISLPDTVTTIADEAFSRCYALRSVTPGAGIRSIGAEAFASAGVERIQIPPTTTNIASDAFSDCRQLQALFVDPTNQNYASLGGVLFNKQISDMLVYPPEKLAGPYAIPATVTNVAANACRACPHLTRLVVPSSVRTIQADAFYRCESLAEISFADGLVSIGPSAFAGCPVHNVQTPPSLKVIDDRAFADSGVTNVALANGLQRLGVGAFSPYLTHINLPASLAEIGRPAFQACWQLQAISVDPSNTNFCDLDGVLFDKEKRLLIQYPVGREVARYEIPSTVTVIGAGAFDGSRTAEVAMGDSITTIEPEAFLATGATNVIFGAGLSNIGSNAFYLAIHLASARIPAAVTTIDSRAFNSCMSLGNLVFEGAPTNFGAEVFVYAGITNIEFGAMTEIPNGLFKGCLQLREVTFPKTIIAIGDESFSETGLRTVRIGDGVQRVGYHAFYNCRDLTEVWVPPSVTTVGAFAFSGNVYFEGDCPQSLATDAPVYYLPGTRGWYSTPNLFPILWNPRALMTDGNFGVKDGRFGFTVTGNTRLTIDIQASDDPATHVWTPVGVVSLAGGASRFIDPDAPTNSKARFYRFRAH